MANMLINNMGNGVSNTYNRYPNNYQSTYQGLRANNFVAQSMGPQTNVIWIPETSDVSYVYSYPVINDSHLLFGDSKENVFYYREVDKSGSIVRVLKMPFTSEVIFPKPVEQPTEGESKASSESYVTKEEYTQLFSTVESISNKLDELLK